MKKVIKYLSILAISAVAATSCSDYLEVDRYFGDRMTLENVFTNQDYAEQWLADTYSHLKGNNTEVCGKYSSPHNFADDQTFGDGHVTNHYGYVTSGQWSQLTTLLTYGQSATMVSARLLSLCRTYIC